MNKLRILLADDHEIVRQCLALLIERELDMQVVGQACDGREALAKARTLKPDVIVMDLSMPQMNGLDATLLLKTEFPHIKVLVLTVHEDKTYLTQICKSQADGYLLKRSASDEVIQAIRRVAAGGIYLDSTLARDALLGEKTQTETGGLSDREREVLRGFAWGFTAKEVANQLSISQKSVETYKTRLAEKLGLRSRADMVQYAASQGWLTQEASLMRVSA